MLPSVLLCYNSKSEKRIIHHKTLMPNQSQIIASSHQTKKPTKFYSNSAIGNIDLSCTSFFSISFASFSSTAQQHNTHVAETSKNLRSMKLWNLCFGVSSKDDRRKAELPAEDESDENGVASSTPTDPSAVVRERELHFDKIYFEIRFTQHNILLTQSPHRHTICTHNREEKEIEKSKNVKRINKIEWMNDFLITVKSDSTLRRAARSRRKPCNKIEWRRSSSRARSRVLIEKLWDDEKWF